VGKPAKPSQPVPQDEAVPVEPATAAPEVQPLSPEAVLKPLIEAFQCFINYRQLPTQRFWAVVVPDDAPALLLDAETMAELAEKLRPYHGTHSQVFPFSGQRLGITKPPRFLISGNERHALFSATDDPTIDNDGYMSSDDDPPGSTQPE
jgi:hypothetical protein